MATCDVNIAKTVTYKNKLIDDAVITDFYDRLNALRTWAGVSNLTPPTLNTTIRAAQVKTDLQSAITSTKSAVSFLTGFTLIYDAPDATAGNKIHAGVFQNAAGTTVSRAERNIGDMEAVCRAFKSSDNSGFNTAFWSTDGSTCSGFNSSFWSTNNSSNACATRNAPNWSSNNNGFCAFHKSGNWVTFHNGHFQPNWASFDWNFDYSGFTFFCPTWAGFSHHNLPWFNAHNNGNCSGFNTSFWSTNNQHTCASHNAPNWSSDHSTNTCASNKAPNFSSYTLTFTAHKNSFKVEGIDCSTVS